MASPYHLGFVKGCCCDSCVPDVARYADERDAQLITIDWSRVEIDTRAVDEVALPEAQRKAIVLELTRRFDQLLRAALCGGPQ